MKTGIVILAMLLMGCGTAVRQHDAREWHAVSCGGILGWDTCHRKAGAVCQQGYDFADQEESLIAQKRIMRYSCKAR